MPEPGEAERLILSGTGLPKCRASGRGLWEPPLRSGSGQGKGGVSGAGRVCVPDFHFHCTTQQLFISGQNYFISFIIHFLTCRWD